MKTTPNIDDELLTKAQQVTGITEKTALVKNGLRALIEQESTGGWCNQAGPSRSCHSLYAMNIPPVYP